MVTACRGKTVKDFRGLSASVHMRVDGECLCRSCSGVFLNVPYLNMLHI